MIKEKIAEMEKDNNYEPEYIGGYKEALEDVRALIENRDFLLSDWQRNEILEELSK